MAPTNRPLGYSTATVLAAVGAGHRHGFDIMDVTGQRSGTVYRALSRLGELGYVRSKWEASSVALEARRPRRRYYQITPAGRRELDAARERFAALANLGAAEADPRGHKA